MISKAIYSKTALPVISKSLDTAMLRSRVISNNIANISTPEYKRVEVSFEQELKKALNKSRLKGTMTNKNHLSIGRKDISRLKATAYRPVDPTLPSGVNNVDIDMEMAKLAENQLMFNTGLRLKKDLSSILNSAITGKS